MIMKKLILSITLLIGICVGLVGVVVAAPTDSAKSQVCLGINAEIGGADCGGTTGESTITKVIRNILQIISWIAGIAALIMIVLAGLRYITSGGDSSSIASAKQSLIYALVGLVIVAVAQSIVYLVLKTTR